MFSTAVALLVILALLIAAFPEDSAVVVPVACWTRHCNRDLHRCCSARLGLPSLLFGGFFLQAPMAFAAFILGLRASAAIALPTIVTSRYGGRVLGGVWRSVFLSR